MSKRYQIIYADPPWRYDFSKKTADSIEVHYPSMDIEEICGLPIPELTEENCILFLWATSPKLREALMVIDAWGFEYKTHAIWDKMRVGIGHWFLGQHELLMVATKGTEHPPKNTERISSVIKSKKREHSRKPDRIRSLISKWYPKHTRIELFARQRFEGWDVWGNEAPTDIQTGISRFDNVPDTTYKKKKNESKSSGGP